MSLLPPLAMPFAARLTPFALGSARGGDERGNKSKVSPVLAISRSQTQNVRHSLLSDSASESDDAYPL